MEIVLEAIVNVTLVLEESLVMKAFARCCAIKEENTSTESAFVTLDGKEKSASLRTMNVIEENLSPALSHVCFLAGEVPDCNNTVIVSAENVRVLGDSKVDSVKKSIV
jgi:hypothetical protein